MHALSNTTFHRGLASGEKRIQKFGEAKAHVLGQRPARKRLPVVKRRVPLLQRVDTSGPGVGLNGSTTTQRTHGFSNTALRRILASGEKRIHEFKEARAHVLQRTSLSAKDLPKRFYRPLLGRLLPVSELHPLASGASRPLPTRSAPPTRLSSTSRERGTGSAREGYADGKNLGDDKHGNLPPTQLNNALFKFTEACASSLDSPARARWSHG